MVTVVPAEDMGKGIGTDGHIALYGIYFDYDKADLKPDSKPQLEEIAKMLKADTALNVLVVGHTDNQGELAYNADLSKRRAESVVQALGKEYSIDAKRLTAQGVGMAAPVASNDAEEGRAKNRRVEIVKR
jgi:outer membrane protein OmpA-like peptidoglycan-associated protein